MRHGYPVQLIKFKHRIFKCLSC